jgi:hypothetical protein
VSQPRGRDALFGPPQASPDHRSDRRSGLWSAPPRRRGSVVVECSRCLARTPVPLVVSGPCLVAAIWIPGRAFSRLMRCPACRKVAWCRVHWRTLLD